MLTALQSVLSVILMIAVGFFLSRRGWFDEAASSLLAKLVVSLALPCTMIANLMGGYDRAKLLSMLPGLPVPFLVMTAGFAISWLLAAALRLPKHRRGVLASMFALSNAIFIGLPVNQMLFGDESLPYVLLYYIANTVMFWTVGVYGMARDGALAEARPAPRLVSRQGLKRILSPPLLAFAIAVTLIMFGVSLPRPIMDLCTTMGGMTTPLSMLFIGIVVSRVDWRQLRVDRGLVLVLVGRFFVAPLMFYLVVRHTALPLLMKKVFLIQAAMPAMTQTPILARACGADAEYAGVATSLTTVLSLATIPVFMTVVDLIW